VPEVKRRRLRSRQKKDEGAEKEDSQEQEWKTLESGRRGMDHECQANTNNRIIQSSVTKHIFSSMAQPEKDLDVPYTAFHIKRRLILLDTLSSQPYHTIPEGIHSPDRPSAPEGTQALKHHMCRVCRVTEMCCALFFIHFLARFNRYRLDIKSCSHIQRLFFHLP